MEIDIRTGEPKNIKKIRFGNDRYDLVEVNERLYRKYITVASEYGGEVDLKDIDNLILALQKAKELWGGGK